MEEALIEVPTMRRLAGIDLISDRISDDTTIQTFRHLLEKQGLGEQIFQIVNPAGELLHGDETVVYGDVGYHGIRKRLAMADKITEFRVAMGPGTRRALPDIPEGRLQDLIETAKVRMQQPDHGISASKKND